MVDTKHLGRVRGIKNLPKETIKSGTIPEAHTLNIDDFRPHLAIMTLEGNAHVLPQSLVEDWITGRQQIADGDEWEIVIRSILKEWMFYAGWRFDLREKPVECGSVARAVAGPIDPQERDYLTGRIAFLEKRIKAMADEFRYSRGDESAPYICNYCEHIGDEDEGDEISVCDHCICGNRFIPLGPAKFDRDGNGSKDEKPQE